MINLKISIKVKSNRINPIFLFDNKKKQITQFKMSSKNKTSELNKDKNKHKDKQLNASLKVNQVKPIILQLDQQHSQNQSLIKNMIKQNNNNIKYSGGYKNSGIGGSSIGGKKQLYRPEHEYQQQKIDTISKVYDQLGVGTSKLQHQQPKYRIMDQNNKISANETYSMQQLQSKIQLLKQDRNQRNNSLMQKVDNYTLIDTKSRFQNVMHVQSSLDQISLENIEAKLEAHRRNMREIEEEYHAKKGKNIPADRYGYLKVNIDVDKQYAELDVDKDQVYDLVRKREEVGEQQMEFEDLWEQKKRNNPKLAQYDAKYQEYKVSKDAKNVLGSVVRNSLFTWDKYTQPPHLQNKSKSKIQHSQHSQSPSKQHLIPHSTYSKSPEKQKQKSSLKNQLFPNDSKFGPDGLQSIKDLQDIIAKKDDKFMAAYIFTQVDTSKTGLISKQQLHDYLLKQQFIIRGYNIDTKWLFTDLDNFETKRKGMMNKTELAIFLATLQKIQHPKLNLTNKSNLSNISNISANLTLQATTTTNNKSSIISFFPKYQPIFQKLFNILDFNDDKLLKRSQYIENIYIDSDCVKILDQEVLQIKQIGKSIKVRQIIGFILDDYQKQKNQKLKKSKQYITFTRFCQYFDIPQSLDLNRIDKNTIRKKQDSSTQYDIYDIPQQYLQLLKDIFNQIPRIYQDYIVCADFVQSALRDPQILALSDQLCRVASLETKLPMESLITTLHRMQKECDQYGTWESIKMFFSRRGRPLDWDYQLITQKKEIRSKKMKEERSSFSKSKLQETMKYFQVSDQLRNKSKQRISKLPDRYTVPEPFDITDMKQKLNEDKAKVGEKQFEQLKKQFKQFKANPINKEILQPKPDLIAGKVKKQKSVQKRPQYNYENYENDRVQRALKKAQEKYQMEQKLKEIKQKTEVKAYQIGIDLTKKYQDVIKQEKKKRQNSKYKPTQPKASQSLYPKNPQDQKAKKIEKVKQNMQKADEIAKRKNEIIAEDIKKAKQKNEEAKKLAQEAKKRQKQQEKKRDEIATEGFDFKPKINKKELSQKQKQAIQKARLERERKKKQQDQLRLKVLQDRKKKILDYDKKPNFITGDELKNMTDQQILDKLDDINFEDLLLTQKDKNEYRKQFDNQNKTKRQLKDRESGLAGRQRAVMQEQERRIMQEKRIYKQKVQKQKTAPKQNMSKLNAKGEKAAYQNDLTFHKSKALRRYRAIMDGKKPQSQFDKYSIKGDIGPTQRVLPQQSQQQQNQSQQIDQNNQQDEQS